MAINAPKEKNKIDLLSKKGIWKPKTSNHSTTNMAMYSHLIYFTNKYIIGDNINKHIKSLRNHN